MQEMVDQCCFSLTVRVIINLICVDFYSLVIFLNPVSSSWTHAGKQDVGQDRQGPSFQTVPPIVCSSVSDIYATCNIKDSQPRVQWQDQPLVFTSPLPHYPWCLRHTLLQGVGVHAFNPSTQKAEGQVISVTEFKASLLYIVNCRPARVKK